MGREKVGFWRRGTSKQLRRTVDLNQKLKAVREEIGELDALHVLDSLIHEGARFESEWTLLVDAPELSAFDRADKKEWVAWGKRGMILISTLEKDSKPTSGRKGFLRLHGIKEDVEKRLDSLSPGEAQDVGQQLLARLEPLSRGELPEDAEPGFIHKLMLEADLWLAATSAS